MMQGVETEKYLCMSTNWSESIFQQCCTNECLKNGVRTTMKLPNNGAGKVWQSRRALQNSACNLLLTRSKLCRQARRWKKGQFNCWKHTSFDVEARSSRAWAVLAPVTLATWATSDISLNHRDWRCKLFFLYSAWQIRPGKPSKMIGIPFPPRLVNYGNLELLTASLTLQQI